MKKLSLAFLAILLISGLSFPAFSHSDSPLGTQMKQVKKIYKQLSKEEDLSKVITEAAQFKQAINKAKTIGLNKEHNPTEKDIKMFDDHIAKALKFADDVTAAAKANNKAGVADAINKIKQQRNEAHKYFDVN